MAKKQNSESDTIARIRAKAEKAKPHMRVVSVSSLKQTSSATPDATTPEVEDAQRKYGSNTGPVPESKGELYAVVHESNDPSDSRTAPIRRTSIYDKNGNEVGSEG